MITVGGAVVYLALRKQKCMMKSTTESELVGLTDFLGMVKLFHEFVSFMIGQAALIPSIYQDSTLVISLITIGGGVTRRKHLRAMMNLAKESIQKKRTSVVYLIMTRMPADGASKVLEGKAQVKYANFVLGVSSFDG